MKCISCGLRNVEEARFCGHCGTNLQQRVQTSMGEDESSGLVEKKDHDWVTNLADQIIFCFRCGLRNCDVARFCGQCGVNLKHGLP